MATCHAQFGNQHRHGGRQGVAAIAARGAQCIGGMLPIAVRTGDSAIQPLQGGIGIGQCIQFDGERVTMGGQLFGRDAVLACQILHAGELAFDLGQRIGVQVQIAADAFQQGECFVQLDDCRVQQRIHIMQTWLVGGFTLQPAAQVLHAAGQCVVTIQRSQPRFASSNERRRMRVAAVVGVKFGQHGRLQWLRLQFVQLVLQPLLAVGHIATGEQGGTFFGQLLPACGRVAHRVEQRGVAGGGIEQISLLAAHQQGLLGVLAVNFHQ